MGTQILLYYTLLLWAKMHALLPMPVLYVLSDVLYFLIYRIVGYRRAVVRTNMAHAFPDQTERERRRLERKFYHHFADYIVETIKLSHISRKELNRRTHFSNPELIRSLIEQGHPCILMVMGHYGNWEWFTGFHPIFGEEVEIHQIYRPLKNKAFDRLFIFMRTRFHAFVTKKTEVIREIIRLKRTQTPSLFVFIADQTPSRANLHYWTTFLNQESAILTGPERIAARFDLPVVFADVKQIKRGYYTVDAELITDRPKEKPDGWITEEYIRRMERCILREPAYWLWTHKRWKYKHINILSTNDPNLNEIVDRKF
jgi:KDO2-lipid IV(A) lauroyltransferase